MVKSCKKDVSFAGSKTGNITMTVKKPKKTNITKVDNAKDANFRMMKSVMVALVAKPENVSASWNAIQNQDTGDDVDPFPRGMLRFDVAAGSFIDVPFSGLIAWVIQQSDMTAEQLATCVKDPEDLYGLIGFGVGFNLKGKSIPAPYGESPDFVFILLNH